MRAQIREQRGSFSIEAVATMGTLALIVSCGIGYAYFAFARVWLDRAGYEALICLSTSASVGDCQSDFERTVNSGLPVGQVRDLHLERGPRQAHIGLRFVVGQRELFRHRDSRSLPLMRGPR